MRYIQGRNYSPRKPKRSKGYWQKPTSRRVRHPTEHVFGYRSTRSRTSPFEGLQSIPWGKIFLGVSTVSWLLLMLYLPYFQITRVSIAGLQLLKRDEVVAAINNKFLNHDSWLPKSNYFLVNTADVEKYLTSEYSLSAAHVKKSFPSTLEAVLEEKVTSIIYDDGKNYSLIDQKGQLIRNLAPVGSDEFTSHSKATFLADFFLTTNGLEAEQSTTTAAIDTTVHLPNFVSIRRNFGLFPIVYQLTQTSTSTNSDRKISADMIQGVITLYEILDSKKFATPNYVVVGDQAAGAALVTNMNWRLYFDPTGNIQDQIKNAQIILKDNTPTDYIDVRYGDHVYWK